VCKILNPKTVILFGSYVNGNPHELSDIAIVFNGFQGDWYDTAAGDIKPYVGMPGVQRLKIGDYRILFEIISIPNPDTEQEGLVKAAKITRIAQRGQAYTKETKGKRG
jgi:hypothetical protein